jgi:hypothetical protein
MRGVYPDVNIKMEARSLELLLFTHDANYADAAVQGGFDGIIVDWEWSDKPARQAGWNTEVNRGTEANLVEVVQRVDAPVICRINNKSRTRRREAVRALELGASEIWLPMVRQVVEIEECLDAIGERARLGILAETIDAMAMGEALSALPLVRVYVGLNDLQIDTGRPNLFTALCDGTVQAFRERFSGNFGVAGVTVPEAGRPIASRLLLAEMARLGCGFAVARRSFRADVPDVETGVAVEKIRNMYREMLLRDEARIAADHAALHSSVAQMAENSVAAGSG